MQWCYTVHYYWLYLACTDALSYALADNDMMVTSFDQSIEMAELNILSGLYTAYDAAGNKRYEGQCVHGQQDGEWLYFNEDGQVIDREHFENGQRKFWINSKTNL